MRSAYNQTARVDVERRFGATLIRMRGDLDVRSIGSFARIFDAAIEAAPLRVFVIFDDCRFPDSSALLVLIRARERLGKALKLVGRRSTIRVRAARFTRERRFGVELGA